MHLHQLLESPCGAVAVLSDDAAVASYKFLRTADPSELTNFLTDIFKEVAHRRTVTGGISFGDGRWMYIAHNIVDKLPDGRSGSFLVPQQRYFCNSSFERLYEKVEKLLEDTSTNWRIDNIVFGAGTWNCTMRGDAPKGSRSWFKCVSRKKMVEGIGQLRKQIPSLRLSTLVRGPEHWMVVLEGAREAPDSGEQYLEDESAAALVARVQSTCSQNRLLVNAIAGNRAGGYFASLVPGPPEVSGQIVSFGATAEAAAAPLLAERDARVHALVFFEEERLWFLVARRYRSPIVRHTVIAAADAAAALLAVKARCAAGEGHTGAAPAPASSSALAAPLAPTGSGSTSARRPSRPQAVPTSATLTPAPPPAAEGSSSSRKTSLGAPGRPRAAGGPAAGSRPADRKPSLSPSRAGPGVSPAASPKRSSPTRPGPSPSPAEPSKKRSPFLARQETIKATAGTFASSHAARLPFAFAVIIGVDQYAEDARTMFDTLTSTRYCAYDPSNVRLLTGAAATRDAVRLAVLDVAFAAEKALDANAASFLFYFSGHGTVKPSPQLVLSGEAGLSREELMSTVAAVQVKVPRTLIILDCCHAGAIGALQAMKSGPTEWETTNRQLADALLPKTMVMGRGHVQWVSSRPDELSRGYVAGPGGAKNASGGAQGGQSLFSKHLLSGLKGGTACKTRGGRSAEACNYCIRLRKVAEADNSLITISALFKYVVDHVREESDDAQHVQSSAIGLEDDFAIARLAPT